MISVYCDNEHIYIKNIFSRKIKKHDKKHVISIVLDQWPNSYKISISDSGESKTIYFSGEMFLRSEEIIDYIKNKPTP